MLDDPPVRRTRVGRLAPRTATVPIAIGLLVFGTAVFAKLVDNRAQDALSVQSLPPLAMSRMSPPQLPLAPAAPASGAPFIARAIPVTSSPQGAATYVLPPRLPLGPSRPAAQPEQTGGAALLFDFYQPRASSGTRGNVRMQQDQGTGSYPSGAAPVRSPSGYDPTGDAITAAGPPPSREAALAVAAAASASQSTGNERFAERVGGKQAEVTQAVQMGNLDRVVPQGAIIAAVMETALNSDLPGYARAVVTKDVLAFDGSAVLVPAGTRVIGEYNSGVAQGASRIFIVWSRMIRPDGVSISLGSPATDELGRGGLGGKVNRHFLQKFSGAILLSLLTGGISAATASLQSGSSVIVSTSSEATSLATQALRGTDIPPTIKTNQGALVRIFVARDLDFSAVGLPK